MHLTIDQERMSDFFLKHHIRGLPRDAVVHELGVDHGDYHSHPWPFTSFVISGAYIEEVLNIETGEISHVTHPEGESFRIAAEHVHRVVEVAPDTVTMILPGEWVQKPGFFRWENGTALYRDWDQPDFTPIKAAGQDESRAATEEAA